MHSVSLKENMFFSKPSGRGEMHFSIEYGMRCKTYRRNVATFNQPTKPRCLRRSAVSSRRSFSLPALEVHGKIIKVQRLGVDKKKTRRLLSLSKEKRSPPR